MSGTADSRNGSGPDGSGPDEPAEIEAPAEIDELAEIEALEAEARALEQAAARRGGLSGARRLLLLAAPLLALAAVALLVWGRTQPATAAAAQAAPAKIGMRNPYLAPPRNAAGPVDAYLTIVNSGGSADRLVSVGTPWAGTVRLVDAEGRTLPWITIPAGGSVTLKPGGVHLELTDPRRTPELHDTVELDPVFAASGSVYVWAPVGPANSLTPQDVMHAMKYMGKLPPEGSQG